MREAMMRRCSIHGEYDESESGCPECREWQDRIESDNDEVKELLSEIAHRSSNPGDYECPHCKYISLRRNASRCPMCHANPGVGYWAKVDEADRVAKERAAQARAAAEKTRQEAENRATLLAQQKRDNDTAALLLVLFVGAIALIAFGIGAAIDHFKRPAPDRAAVAAIGAESSSQSGARPANCCDTINPLDRPGVTSDTSLSFGGPAFRGTTNAVDSVVLSMHVTSNTQGCGPDSSGEIACQIFIYSGGRPNSDVSPVEYRREFTQTIDDVDVTFTLNSIEPDSTVARSFTMVAGATPGHMEVIVAKGIRPGLYRVIVHGLKPGRFSIHWWGPMGD